MDQLRHAALVLVREANAVTDNPLVHITRADGSKLQVTVTLRVDTPIEVDYYRNGGILLDA